jgi:transcriptional regulator with XRE-family HTH domain
MANDLKQTVATKVKQARARVGISQEELASRIDRVVETVSNIERGKSLPTLATLELIARELSVSVHDLLTPSNVSGPRRSAKRDQIETRAIAAIARMGDAQADLAVEILQLMAERGGQTNAREPR